MDISKFDARSARIIVAQLYVAKRLSKLPAKMIKFIMNNRDYFPEITDNMLIELKKEHNISDEDIAKEEDIVFADINAEDSFEKEILEKASKINEIRKEDRSKRDYGYGIKSRFESNVSSNEYNGLNPNPNPNR